MFYRLVFVDNPHDIQFNELMDEFQLGLMAEPDQGFEDFLLDAEEVNVGADIMIVNEEGVVMGGMPQQLENNQYTQEEEQQQMEIIEDVTEAPNPESRLQQFDVGTNIDNGGISCTIVPLVLQPLRIWRPNGGDILDTDVPLLAQPLRSIKPDDNKGKRKIDDVDEAGPSGIKEESSSEL
ncbi:hypothetical protein POM88_041403 [Heracleum sosnowskyi]|uniref:Uncharacterized protein n=1 Tax=Heracleum sosnowskyi TaxID=360622 RepID=A0AAD8HE56_9APIA|nr:hypothetical protein POM88_041403 [Heracleum sosnowskyi]